MDHYQEVLVALSESFMNEFLQISLAEDWRWRHVQLETKDVNLVNQIKVTMDHYREDLVAIVIFIKKTANIKKLISL